MAGRNAGVTPYTFNRAFRGLTGGTFSKQAVTGNYPSAAAREVLLSNNEGDANVLALLNRSSSGYSAFTARGTDLREYLAMGRGGPTSLGVFAGRNYIQSWSGTTAADSLPAEFVFTSDGKYGNNGTTSTVRFYQRFTVNDSGVHFYKGVAFGGTQLKSGGFHENGFMYLANASEPSALDIADGEAAVWLEITATAPKLWIKGRDEDGTLYKTSVPLSTAITATAEDDFVAADSATSLNGRVSSGGLTWSVKDNVWGIASNKAYRSGGTNDSAAFLDTGLTSSCISCDITLSTVRALAGLVFNYTDSTHYTYVQLERTGSTSGRIVTNTKIGASFVDTYTYTTPLTLGATYNLKVGRSGNSLFVYLNGSRVIRVEDINNMAATKQGLFSFVAANGDDGGSRWANFQVDQ